MKLFKAPIFPYAIACLFVLNIPTIAQTRDSVKTDTIQQVRGNWYWLHGCVAFVISGSEAYSLGLSVASQSRLYTLYVRQTVPSYDLGMTSGFNMSEIGGMYGWINQNDWSFSSFSFGLAYCDSRYYSQPRTGIGLVYEAQIALKAYIPGIGLKVFGNINTVYTYLIGGGIVFHLSWMP